MELSCEHISENVELLSLIMEKVFVDRIVRFDCKIQLMFYFCSMLMSCKLCWCSDWNGMLRAASGSQSNTTVSTPVKICLGSGSRLLWLVSFSSYLNLNEDSLNIQNFYRR